MENTYLLLFWLEQSASVLTSDVTVGRRVPEIICQQALSIIFLLIAIYKYFFYLVYFILEVLLICLTFKVLAQPMV